MPRRGRPFIAFLAIRASLFGVQAANSNEFVCPHEITRDGWSSNPMPPINRRQDAARLWVDAIDTHRLCLRRLAGNAYLWQPDRLAFLSQTNQGKRMKIADFKGHEIATSDQARVRWQTKKRLSRIGVRLLRRKSATLYLPHHRRWRQNRNPGCGGVLVW
jgi:hypothetical protein